jgi:hypothetical protein
MYTYKGYTQGDTIYVDITYNDTLIKTQEFASYFKSNIDGKDYSGTEGAIASLKYQGEIFGFSFNGNSYPAEPPIDTTTQPTTNTTTLAPIKALTGATVFNSPDVTDITAKRDELQGKITSLQGIGLPGVKDIPKTLLDKVIVPKLLTQRQVAKKMLMIQGSKFSPPLAEEDAQLMIYGKVYYKGGKLYDNDVKDPACVAQPNDEDYQPPIDENNPMWQKINQMIKDLKNGLLQLGIKLGEFVLALPTAIITIAVSLVALVSSITILPFGAGIPTALSAVQTMLATIKQLQAKTSELLPLLAIIDTIALLLPASAQIVIAQINVIFVLLTTIIAGLTALLGLLGKVTSKLSKTKSKSDSQGLKLDLKAEPQLIKLGDSTKLTASATGGDWNFNFEWSDSLGKIISTDSEVTIKPDISAINTNSNFKKSFTYNCKVSDSKGSIKQAATTITLI